MSDIVCRLCGDPMDMHIARCAEVIDATARLDPRHFHPDEECCSPAEIAAHRAACEAWERGETPDPGGPHLPITEENIAKYAPSVIVKAGACGHITVAHYGIGSYTMPCSVHGYAT